MKKSLALLGALMAAGSISAQGMNAPTTSGAKAAMPLVDAVVQKVDTSRSMIVLKHGDILNLGMPAMTMGFDVADKKMLTTVKPGDKVKFQAGIVGGKATVTEIKRAG